MRCGRNPGFPPESKAMCLGKLNTSVMAMARYAVSATSLAGSRQHRRDRRHRLDVRLPARPPCTGGCGGFWASVAGSIRPASVTGCSKRSWLGELKQPAEMCRNVSHDVGAGTYSSLQWPPAGGRRDEPAVDCTMRRAVPSLCPPTGRFVIARTTPCRLTRQPQIVCYPDV